MNNKFHLGLLLIILGTITVQIDARPGNQQKKPMHVHSKRQYHKLWTSLAPAAVNSAGEGRQGTNERGEGTRKTRTACPRAAGCSCAFHLHGIFGENFSTNGTGSTVQFFSTRKRNEKMLFLLKLHSYSTARAWVTKKNMAIEGEIFLLNLPSSWSLGESSTKNISLLVKKPPLSTLVRNFGLIWIDSTGKF